MCAREAEAAGLRTACRENVRAHVNDGTHKGLPAFRLLEAAAVA
jgi:hypothetical protein